MTEKWDQFKPFKKVEKQDFTFQPSYFEIWKGGKLVLSSGVSAILSANVIFQDGCERVAINFNEPNLRDEFYPDLIFDDFVTIEDRLLLITIPENSNAETLAFKVFKQTFGPTRFRKNFSSIEPFCCNLFFKGGVLSKITFTFGNPEKLIELYK